jgi:hypothetical protein
MKKIPIQRLFSAGHEAVFCGMNFSTLIFNKIKTCMADKGQQAEGNELKHTEFTTRLTFIKGMKDNPEKHNTGGREKRKRKYKTWSMPVQPTGYIKCREHDFL